MFATFTNNWEPGLTANILYLIHLRFIADSADGETSQPSTNAGLEESLAGNVQATKVAEQSLDALDRWSPTFDDD